MSQTNKNRLNLIYSLALTFTICLLSVLAPRQAAGSPISNQTDYYVPDDFPTIQDAIDNVTTGDVIFVRPGTYAENINNMGKQVAIRSTLGPSVTTISGSTGTVVTLTGNGTEISGFTVTGGNASFGAGMHVVGIGALIQGNIFEGNAQGSGGYGAAIGGNNASPTITGNIFRNNTCDNQFLSGVVSFVNSSSLIISNNIFENNPCRGINMTLPVTSAPLVINNTLYGNEVGIRVDRRVPTATQKYRNNIIVNNDIGLEIDFGSEANNPTWENNLVHDNTVDYDEITDQTGINGNISADPEFFDPLHGDYHPLSTSPAIDAGTNTNCPAFDFDGQPRPEGPLCDIGAYEVIQTVVEFSMTNYSIDEGGTAVITVTLETTLPVTATVDFQTTDGTAVAGSDYAAVSGNLTFEPGSVTQTFSVETFDEGIGEWHENLNLVLSNPQSLTVLITAGPPAVLNIIDEASVSMPVMIKN